MEGRAPPAEMRQQLPYSVPISSLPSPQQHQLPQRRGPVPRIMQNAALSMQPGSLQYRQEEDDLSPPNKQRVQQQQAAPLPEWADAVTFTKPPPMPVDFTMPSSKSMSLPPAAACMPFYNPWLWQAQVAAAADPSCMLTLPPWMQSAPPTTLAGLMPNPQSSGGESGAGGIRSAPKVAPKAAPAAAASAASSNAMQGSGVGGGQGKRRGKGGRGRKEQGTEASLPDSPRRINSMLLEMRTLGEDCKMSLWEAMPFVPDMARDVAGSRFLISRLSDAHAEERAAVFDRLLPDIVMLSNDGNGHQVVQKLLGIGTPEQRKAVAQVLQPEALRLSNKMYGCRVMQKAFQACAPEVQLMLATELRRGVVDCIKSMHGNYVIQMCIEQMPPDSVSFVVEAIEERAEQTAQHVYGCRIIQRLLEHCSPARLETMLKRILGNVLRLAEDAYGNYVIRHILDHGKKEHKQRIIEAVRDNVTQLSLDKCASNVVEKCIEASTVGEHAHALQADRERLVRSILGEADDPNPPIYRLADDRFGKYVVQCLIDNSKREEKQLLHERLMSMGPRTRKGSLSFSANLAALGRQLQD